MIEQQCDICKKKIQEQKYWNTLNENFRPHPDIKDMCPDCYHEIISMEVKIRTAISEVKSSWMKGAIQRFMDKF